MAAAAAADEALATLQAMFADQGWDEASLREILKSSGNDAEMAVDEVLAAGSPEAWKAQRSARRPAVAESEVAMPAPQPSDTGGVVSVLVPPGASPGETMRMSHDGRTFVVAIPPGVEPGQRFNAAIPEPLQPVNQPASRGRGRRVDLPTDFLCVPSSLRNDHETTDQQLALMLQQEAFLDDERAATRRQSNLDRRPPPQHQQQQQQQQQQASVSSMFSSVGSSMRAGLASATTSLKTMTSKLQAGKGAGQRPENTQAGAYGRIDLEDELQEESPLHGGGANAAATQPRPPSTDMPPPAFGPAPAPNDVDSSSTISL